MAEMVLSFLVEETLSRMLTLVTDEFKLLRGLDKELERLRDSLDTVRDMLQVAEEKQVTLKSVRRWLHQLKDAAYDAEDVLDELAYENLHRKVEKQNQSELEVRSFFSFSKGKNYVKKASFHTKIVHKVREVNELLDKIKNASSFGLQMIIKDRFVPQIDLDRLTDSVLENPVMGREVDVSKIVNLLSNFCDQQVLTIVPIVGMGGLGKTALAQLVCQEIKKKKLFDLNIWICVSNRFDEQRILGEMLQTISGNMGGLTNKDAILNQLEKDLDRKKFLLVLDDVWGDVSKGWDGLKSRLLKVSSTKGNAIILTTRSEEVASIVETSSDYRHNLNILSIDECWSIIKQRVCGNGGTFFPSDLETIGKEIAEKCKGVPLAAKVLGGTLGFERDKESWLSIRNNKVLNASDTKDNVEAILKLSFDCLPSHLKPCFAYCSIFPKDFVIVKEHLIQLWMAEGFLMPCSTDTGNKCFSALFHNSFFQDARRDRSENIVTCKMHDLVHDLALSFSKSETLTSENYSAGDDLSSIRRINVDCQDLKETLMAIPKGGAKKLRTLLLQNVVFEQSWKLKSLRSLNLAGANIEELPSSIGEWKQLRYLDISETKIKEFPDSITKLYNLHTLRFIACALLTKFPRKKMKNLVSLRHYEFSYDYQMVSGFGQLTCLETLRIFVVGNEEGGSIQELEHLNNLRGVLEINHLEEVRDEEEAKRANLQGKTNIESLTFFWSFEREGAVNDKQVLEALQPHLNIRSIEIYNYWGEKFPTWLLKNRVPSDSVLNNLVRLTLGSCKNCEQIPCLGSLPGLQYLKVTGMKKVRYIGNEFYGIENDCSRKNGRKLFPALKHFSLITMDSLAEWRAPDMGKEDETVDIFPCLEELCIMQCRLLRNIPISNASSLVRLELDDCDELSYLVEDLKSFPSLKTLRIGHCNKLTSLPSALQSFSSLEKLTIKHCDRLTSVPEDLEKMNGLVHLEITNCPSLSFFPKNVLCRLSRLEKLRVGGFSEELDDFSYLNSVQQISSLEELCIYGRSESKVKSLPEELQGLTALNLKTLSISQFNEIEALPDWLSNFSSLQFLQISECQNLKNLPAAAAMQRLSKLYLLTIFRCPLLGKNCAKENGSEWSKISHIPKIEVDFECIK